MPQIVVKVIRMTASPMPALGRGTSSTRISFGPRKTFARIVFRVRVVEEAEAGAGRTTSMTFELVVVFILLGDKRQLIGRATGSLEYFGELFSGDRF